MRQVLRTSTKRKAVEDTSVRPSKIVLSEIENCTSVYTDLLLLNDVNQLRDSVYRARRQILPVLPKNMNEVHDYLETNDIITNTKKENFLLINNKIDYIIIFSTMTNLKFLCSLESIYVDGTFE